MNYKFYDKINFFDENTTNEELNEHFSFNKYYPAFFSKNGKFLGRLERNEYIKNNCIFNSSLLHQEYIKDFTHFCKDHRKIIDYFTNKSLCGVVINNGTIVGEFKQEKDYVMPIDVLRKKEAYEKSQIYKKEIIEFAQSLGKSIAVLALKTLPHYIDYFPNISLSNVDNYDIIINAYIAEDILNAINMNKFVGIDDFLACAILNKIDESSKKILYFFEIPAIKKNKLLPIEKNYQK